MENLWEMIAKARGVELNEEFLYAWDAIKRKYRINEKGLEIYEEGQWHPSSLANNFIRGEGKIEKLPFRPQIGGRYYTIILNNKASSYEWHGDTSDYARLVLGLVFRTEQEAEAYIPTWQEIISKL